MPTSCRSSYMPAALMAGRGNSRMSARTRRASWKTRNSNRYFHQLVPTALEQKQLELISARYIESSRKEWVQYLGHRTIAFTGRAGTGKTLRLLRTGHYLITECMDTLLLLTFNQALARDLDRLMCFHRFATGYAPKVQTIDEFLYALGSRLGIVEAARMHEDGYYEAIRELVAFAIQDSASLAELRKYTEDFTYVAIDEAQDWFPSEREIILALFAPSQILIADGNDQVLRAANRANWKGDIQKRNGILHPVMSTIALRQKKNIAIFINSLAEKLQLGWSVRPYEDVLGGEIFLFSQLNGKIFNTFISEYLGMAADEYPEYAPIDYMVLTGRKSFKQIDALYKGLNILQCQYWDAITKKDRDRIPQRDEIRCVSFESCRGLEAWATILLDLDAWHAFCQDRQAESTESLHMLLPTWFLIPFTRAKARMLVHLPQQPEIREALLATARENPGFVTRLN